MAGIYYSTHALFRMKGRGIDKENVRVTLSYPDRVEKLELPNRLRVQKLFGSRILVVIYKQKSGGYKLIITAFWKT